MYKFMSFFSNHKLVYENKGVKNDATSEMFVVGPEFCGGALSKGGTVTGTLNSDDVGGVITSKQKCIYFQI